MARSQTDIRSLRPKQTLGNSFCGKLQSILFWLEAVLNKQSKRLAYIEDEIEMIDLVRLILGRQGFTVLGANGGREGLDLVRKELPDLVLLDLMMPDMDGWDVYHQIKSEELTRDIPVL
jgi:CheY-like chemotaxis protein